MSESEEENQGLQNKAGKRQEVDQKVQQYQVLQQQIEALQERKTEIMEEAQSLEESISSLKELQDSEEGKEIMFSLGERSFAEGKLVDNSKAIVEVGAGVFSKKDIDEAVEFIEEKKEEKKEQEKHKDKMN